jgi:thiamine pyrophosphate-dependent acetolactate synthase large subunit-like protein
VAVHTVEELRSAIAASTAVTGPMVIDVRLDAAEHVGNRR